MVINSKVKKGKYFVLHLDFYPSTIFYLGTVSNTETRADMVQIKTTQYYRLYNQYLNLKNRCNDFDEVFCEYSYRA